MLTVDKSVLILIGMLVGFASIYFGYKLFLKGIEGSSTLEGNIQKVKLSLRNAAPGLFFALYGAVIVVAGIYKPEIHSIKIDKDSTTIYQSKGENNNLENEVMAEALNYLKKGDLNNAKILYLMALTINSKNYVAHNNISNIYNQTAQADMAIVHANLARKYCDNNEFRQEIEDTIKKIQSHNK